MKKQNLKKFFDFVSKHKTNVIGWGGYCRNLTLKELLKFNQNEINFEYEIVKDSDTGIICIDGFLFNCDERLMMIFARINGIVEGMNYNNV